MVQALAPRFSRFWLALALLALAPSSVLAQNEAGKAAAKKGAAEDDDDKDAGVIDSGKENKRGVAEVYKDPRVEKTLENKFKEFPAQPQRQIEADKKAVASMAGMQANPDRATIERVLDSLIADMTNHSHIRTILDPKAFKPSDRDRAIERASQLLIKYYTDARANKNEAFLAVYIPVLFSKLTPLLENHLFARVQASIVLAMAARPAFIDTFTKQIADGNQVLWVKLWAARGITNATSGGKVTIDVIKGTAATKALVGFLKAEAEAPWWIQLRVFEALGSLRLPSTTGPTGPPDVAAILLDHASDPKAKVESRAWAAWALGMLNVPANTKFNYALESYQVGQIAAELGDKIGKEYDLHSKNFVKQSDRARFLAALLMYQVYPALSGDDDLRGSGLLKSGHPAAVAARPFMTGLDGQLREVSQAALELLNAGGNQQKKTRDELGKQVNELKSYLDKNRPTDANLFPGGPKIPLNPAQVTVVPPAK
jgi:hypothetical protein